MGNWFGTVVGVIVGVPVGIALSKLQQKAQADEERAREQAVKRERQTSTNHRVYDELQNNLALVNYLAGVLSKSPSARLDLWNWAERIASGMEFEAYRELDGLLLPEERGHYGAVLLAYYELRRLTSRIREAAVAHDFLIGYSANENEANVQLAQAKAHAGIVQSEVASALDRLKNMN